MTLQASGAISFSDVNTELGLSSTSQISMNDTAVRTLFNQASGAISMTAGYGKSNTSTPGAPTGVSGSATSCSAISVSFSAPSSNGGLTIDYYQAISSPGCITATGTSPISVTGLSASTSYTFRVRAHNSKGYGCYSSSSGSITTQAVRGCATFTTPGCTTWVVPSGVTSISVLTIGSGGSGAYGIRQGCPCCGYEYCGGTGGGGGGLSFNNNYSVTPGTSYHVYVGAGGVGSTLGTRIYLSSYSSPIVYGQNGSNGNGPGLGTGGYGGGGYGGNGGGPAGYNSYSCGYSCTGGGGGAGGYSGAGGLAGGSYAVHAPGFTAYAGNGGGGGGGARGQYTAGGGGGGGVGLYGQGSNGSAGSNNCCPTYQGGRGGSGGSNGGKRCGISAGIGGAYGGGGGAGNGFGYGSYPSAGGSGAVRIVWPGNTRSFPSTDVGA
jgi:hypothetical protein